MAFKNPSWIIISHIIIIIVKILRLLLKSSECSHFLSTSRHHLDLVCVAGQGGVASEEPPTCLDKAGGNE